MLEQSIWIWNEPDAQPDSYAEFVDDFAWDGTARVTFTVCSDSNYALYLNGTLAAFGQYACYESHPVANPTDITGFCVPGENRAALIVWYYGTDFSTYCVGKAGVIYEIAADGAPLCVSSTQTRSRRSRAYRSGERKVITSQLGYSFWYSLPDETPWMTGEPDGFSPSVPVDKPTNFTARPIPHLHLGARVHSIQLGSPAQNVYIFDLQCEHAGFLDIAIESRKMQTITFAYGEHLVNGRVLQHIGDRDFSVKFTCNPGVSAYMNPFRRLGCRYIEVQCESVIDIRYIGLRPTVFPMHRTTFRPLERLDREIYDACVHTLEVCLHEHYEDTPWREQSLYALDSRNQMLCGYYAFLPHSAPRASLILLSQSLQPDGYLAICAPKAPGLCIPSFSLYFLFAVDEYVQHTGDLSLAAEVYPCMTTILDTFRAHYRDGLVITHWEGKKYWNFYEWQPGLDDGSIWHRAPDFVRDEPDLILNTLLICALMHMASVARQLGKPAEPYDEWAAAMRPAVHQAFWDADRRLFRTRRGAGAPHYSALGNALAILSGVATDDEAHPIADLLAREDPLMIPASTSMRGFVFDALLKCNYFKYKPIILNWIRSTYYKMSRTGSVWECEEGAKAFGNAGSLCHGWSAWPVIYYNLFYEK